MNAEVKQLRFARAVALLNGLSYLAIGLLLLLAPEWFFTNIGNFPPFNRHYAGDLGSFLVALGQVVGARSAAGTTQRFSAPNQGSEAAG